MFLLLFCFIIVRWYWFTKV